MPLYDFRCPSCGQVYEVTRPARRASEPLLCVMDRIPCEAVLADSTGPAGATPAGGWSPFGHGHREPAGEHAHGQGIGQWGELLAELRQIVVPWTEQLRASGMSGGDVFFACLAPAMEFFAAYSTVVDAEGRSVPLEGDPGAAEPHRRGYMAYLWEALDHVALDRAFGTTYLQPGGVSPGLDVIEDDARLAVLLLSWALPPTGSPAEATASDPWLALEVVQSFTRPLGIRLEDWDGRIVRIQDDLVGLIPASERRGAVFETADGDAPRVRAGATTLDRVHAAMLLQADGDERGLRDLLDVEQRRGPEFRRLAAALARLSPPGSAEERQLAAVLLAMTA